MQKSLLAFILCICAIETSAQTIGGSSVFNFLRLPNTPQLAALGGVNVSNISNDVGLSFNNPALLRENMHGQVNTVFNSLYAGIKHYHVSGAYNTERFATNFYGGIYYLNYGDILQTDAAGNELGSFRPGDYAVQLGASRKYLHHWHYGVAVKFIHSNYGLYRSNALALDAGVAYYDSTHTWQAALVFRHMGLQLKTYAGTRPDDLPFDIQAGITKRLKKAPIQFSITAHHLHRFDIRYNDSSFNNENGFTNVRGNFADRLFRHLVLASQFYIGERIELTTAYNYLRRKELNIDQSANGFTGFSLGVGVLFQKLEIRYARGYYQNNTGYNQFGLTLRFDR